MQQYKTSDTSLNFLNFSLKKKKFQIKYLGPNSLGIIIIISQLYTKYEIWYYPKRSH